MTKTNINKKNITLKLDDVLEVAMKIESQNLDFNEEEANATNEYELKYIITYFYPNKSGFFEVEFIVDKDSSASFDDIKRYIEQYLKEDFAEIAEYELFDIDNEGDYQTAKIKIKKLA